MSLECERLLAVLGIPDLHRLVIATADDPLPVAVYADGRIYVQSEEGNGVVLAAGRDFKLLAENPIGERTMASYAIAKKAIFLRGEKHLYRIELPGKRERNNR